MTRKLSLATGDGSSDRFAQMVLQFLGRIPMSTELATANPPERARYIANTAAAKAALAAGTLALPPGAVGWLTIVPELVTIWKIQAQMVADIAGAYGKKSFLTREQMLYCLFRHAASQAVRDLVVRTGERLLVRRVTAQVLQNVAHKIGLRITQQLTGKAISRWLPVVGALGVGAYAYYDTGQVAKTAIELFELDIDRAQEGRTGSD